MKKGVSLLVLVISIVVITILTLATFALFDNDDGIISAVQVEIVADELSSYKDVLNFKIASEQLNNDKINKSDIYATWQLGEYVEGNKTDVRYWIPEIKEKYRDSVIIDEGKIKYIGTNATEKAAASKMNMLIVDFEETEAYISSNWSYQVISGTDVRITAYSGGETNNAVIPNTLIFNNVKYTVKELAGVSNAAFTGTLKISDGITIPTLEIFSNSLGITSLEIGKGCVCTTYPVTNYASVFSNSTTLKTIIIGESSEIGENVFAGCNSLENITIKNGANIGTNAFYINTNVNNSRENVLIESNVVLETSAMKNNNIENLNIMNNVTIGNNAFATASFSKIKIGTLVTIGNNCFNNSTITKELRVANNANIVATAVSNVTCQSLIIGENAEIGNQVNMAINKLQIGKTSQIGTFSDIRVQFIEIGDDCIVANLAFAGNNVISKRISFGNNVTAGSDIFHETVSANFEIEVNGILNENSSANWYSGRTVIYK